MAQAGVEYGDMANKPEVGQVAPPIRAQAVGGQIGAAREITLEEFHGRPVVLYFYPKDDTPGCTTQACALRDGWESVKDKAVVLGVSIDPVASHVKFQQKHRLPFALVSDPDKRIVNDYGVWVEKSLYGKKYMGTERSTFVIAADGTLAAVLQKVAPAKHLELVLKALA